MPLAFADFHNVRVLSILVVKRLTNDKNQILTSSPKKMSEMKFLIVAYFNPPTCRAFLSLA